MNDLFDTTIHCDNCNKQTTKSSIEKEGFEIRIAKCPNCSKVWHHPNDLQKYNDFNKIRNKDFAVKLRLVGNSYAVSIPKEIIDSESDIQRQINKMIHLSLEEPRKISIYFKKRIRRIIWKKHD